MKRHEETAERIITTEGLVFALASNLASPDGLREARGYLRAAIVKALEDEFARGQRVAMAGDL